MSIDEARRFASDLARDEALLAKVKPMVSGLASFAEVGRQHGYDFTVEDAKQLMRDSTPREKLSDEQLDAIGGGDGTGSAVMATQVTQTATNTTIQIVQAPAVIAVIGGDVVVAVTSGAGVIS